MSYEQDLITIRDNLASALATESASPKPSYTVDGRSFSWGEYFKQQTEAIENLNKLIERSPWCIINRQVV